MCLLIWGENIEPQVAEKDIKVYKVIRKDGSGLYRNLKIGRKEELWTKGFHYTQTTPFKGKKKTTTGIEIHGNAFHSCANKAVAISKFPYTAMEGSMRVVIMYIPKGALYYKNSNEYASSELVWYK